MTMQHSLSRLALPALAVGSLLVSQPAAASSSSGVDEYLAVTEGVAPNVLFVLDLSKEMDEYCNADKTLTCLEVAKEAIGVLVQHYDWARYGVIGTAKGRGFCGLGKQHATRVAVMLGERATAVN